jgi:hypothetical protein
LTANGVMDLTIPVEKINGSKTLIRDIRIFNHENWQMLHWRAMESAYSNSPFFEYYKDYLLPFYSEKFDFLFDFNFKLLQKTFELLEIELPEIEFTNAFSQTKENENIIDFRNKFDPKKTLPTAKPLYYQVFTEKFGFTPDLSIIDLLFNLGNESELYLSEL